MSEIRVIKTPATSILETVAYIYVMKLGSSDAIFRGSMGISREDCEKLENTFCLTAFNNNRYHIIASAAGACGSLCNGSACFSRVKSLQPCDVKKAFCTGCGCFLDIGQRHDCNAPKCSRCGSPLSAYEQKHCHEFSSEDHICLQCVAKEVGKELGYHDWCHEPKFSKPNRRADVLHMGTEWETQYRMSSGRDVATRAVSDAASPNPYHSNLHCEHDGSITGVEFITEPKTLEDYVKCKDLKNAVEKAKEMGFYNDYHNGAHIHLDRKFFGNSGKLAGVMIAYHVAVWWDCFWLPLSGRNPDHLEYCRKSSIVARDDIIESYDKTRREDGHGIAVNLGNRNTIELRFWSGTLDWNEIIARFDISRALAIWAKKMTPTKLPNCTPQDIFPYVSRPETLEYIRARISDRNILAAIPG